MVCNELMGCDMARIAMLGTAILLSGCSVLENVEIFKSTNGPGWLGGDELVIDCNPEPELIYSKTGDLIETVYPILHPVCDGTSEEEVLISASAPMLSAPTEEELAKALADRRRDRNDRRDRRARREAAEAASRTASVSTRSSSSDDDTGSSFNLNGCGSKPCRQ